MSIEIKNNTFRNALKCKIYYCNLNSSSKGYEFEGNVCIAASNGSRCLIKYYNYDELQKKLSEYMDSLGSPQDNPNRSLKVVLATENYCVLEDVLQTEQWFVAIPRIEEASEATQCIFKIFETREEELFIYEDEAKELAKSIGLTLDAMKDALKKDIKQFSLQRVMALSRKNPIVRVNHGICSSFSFRDGKAKITQCDYSVQLPQFSEDNLVYIYAISKGRNRILSYNFKELQNKLNSYIDWSHDNVANPDRDMRYILEKKHYDILERVLVGALYSDTIPLEKSSKVLQILYHRLLDTPGHKYYVLKAEAEATAQKIGLTWYQMEEILKKDIACYERLKLSIRFHVGDYALVVSHKLLSCFST